MDFEDFEGFKRIKNIKKLNVEQLVSVLSAYKEILGEISYVIGLDYAKIYIDFKGKFRLVYIIALFLLGFEFCRLF